MESNFSLLISQINILITCRSGSTTKWFLHVLSIEPILHKVSVERSLYCGFRPNHRYYILSFLVDWKNTAFRYHGSGNYILHVRWLEDSVNSTSRQIGTTVFRKSIVKNHCKLKLDPKRKAMSSLPFWNWSAGLFFQALYFPSGNMVSLLCWE